MIVTDATRLAVLEALKKSSRYGIRHFDLSGRTITAEGPNHTYYTDYDADLLVAELAAIFDPEVNQ